jgi:hypothetical protein
VRGGPRGETRIWRHEKTRKESTCAKRVIFSSLDL